MTLNSKLKTALSTFPYPYENVVYTDKTENGSDIYFTYNYSEYPDFYGDNEPQCDRCYVMLHLFCPHGFNSVQLRSDVKKALVGVGFSRPSCINASDSNGQHYVFEFEHMEDIE